MFGSLLGNALAGGVQQQIGSGILGQTQNHIQAQQQGVGDPLQAKIDSLKGGMFQPSMPVQPQGMQGLGGMLQPQSGMINGGGMMNGLMGLPPEMHMQILQLLSNQGLLGGQFTPQILGQIGNRMAGTMFGGM